MSYWNLSSNKLIYEIKLKSKFKDLFLNYLFHRFRVLYSQTNRFIVPINWSFNQNILTLNFNNNDFPLSLATKLKPSNKFRRFYYWKSAVLIPITLTIVECFRKKIYGFNQFYPVDGKWIPPVSFFIATRNIENKIRDLEQDIQHFQEWAKFNIKKFQKSMDVDD
ncbi:MAG: hypothetical protein ACTSVV_15330, partial [Promethearchaeota archaeon]